MIPKNVYEVVRRLTRSSLNSIGFDLIRTSKLAEFNLCGLRKIPIKTIIDIGANTGQFARSMRARFPEANFLCFEPLPEPYTMLQNWVNKTPDRVQSFNVAIGNQDGETQMFFHRDFSPSSSLLANTAIGEKIFPVTKNQERVTIKLSTLDHALQNIKLEDKILIKLDVQGYEDRVLEGGEVTFGKAAACILEISLDDLYVGQADFRGLYNRLDQMNYRYAGNLSQVYAEDGHVIYLDSVFVRRDTKV
ncbi:MAG: FkbM family methyltransferase [Anaerolineales bacterium]|nr:FkbM family methyltransferase [Anaerolineales bacterium]